MPSKKISMTKSNTRELHGALGLQEAKHYANPERLKLVAKDGFVFEVTIKKSGRLRIKRGFYECLRCNDSGVYETGNNDFPCSCLAGLMAKFSDGTTGAGMRRARGDIPLATDLL